MRYNEKLPFLFAMLVGAIASIATFQLSFAAGALNCTELFAKLSSPTPRIEDQQDQCRWYGSRTFSIGVSGQDYVSLADIEKGSHMKLTSILVSKTGSAENARFVVQKEADDLKTPPKISLSRGEIGENYIGGYDDNFDFYFLPDQKDVHLVVNTNPIGGQEGVQGNFVQSFRMGECAISMNGSWFFGSRTPGIVSGVPLSISIRINDVFSLTLLKKLSDICPPATSSVPLKAIPITQTTQTTQVPTPNSTSENAPEVQKPIMVGGNGNSERIFPLPVVDSRGVVVIQGMDISPETSGAADLVPALQVSGAESSDQSRETNKYIDLLKRPPTISEQTSENLRIILENYEAGKPISADTIEGEPQMQIAGSDEWVTLKKGDAIPLGARIFTGMDDHLLVSLPGFGIVKVLAFTDITFNQKGITGAMAKGEFVTDLDLRTGDVEVRVDKKTYQVSGQVRTPQSVTSVRGTHFWVSYDEKKALGVVGVYEGEVAVDDLSRSTHTLLTPTKDKTSRVFVMPPIQEKSMGLTWWLLLAVLLVIGGGAFFLRRKSKL